VSTPRTRQGLRDSRGQSLVEFAIVLPLFLIVVLGVVEVGFALVDQHVTTRLTREGSNLISRDVPMAEATAALRSMMARPVNFDNGDSKVIFTVLKRGETTGTANFDRIFVYQRYQYGTYAGTSKITMQGGGSFNGPNYEAANSDTNTGLRVTGGAPANIVGVRGGLIYVTEIYTRHRLMTPLDRFGISVPQTLYSIAYF
jgi:Flp pilus assembly protein TadG